MKRWVISLGCLMAPLVFWFSFEINRIRLRAVLGDSEAMYELGLQYNNTVPDLVRPNPRLGDEWMSRAAERGNPKAMSFLINAYQVVRPEIALRWARRGAELKDPFCTATLAGGYQYGLFGLPVDEQKAKQLYEEAEALDKARWRRR